MLRVAHGRTRSGWCFILLGAVCIFVISLLVYRQLSGVSTPSGWGDVYDVKVDARLNVDARGGAWYMPGCVLREIVVERPIQRSTVTACVTGSSGAQLAVLSAPQNSSRTEYAIKLDTDSNFHLLYDQQQLPSNLLLLNDGRLLGNSMSAGGLFVISPEKLQPKIMSINAHETIKYYLINPSADSIIRDRSGGAVYVRRIDTVGDSRYVAAEVLGKGGAIIHLPNRRVDYITSDRVNDYTDNQTVRQAVSSDGKFLAIVSSSYGLGKIYAIEESCGTPTFEGPDSIPECYSIDFSDKLKANSHLTDTAPFELSFSHDNSELFMKSYRDGGGVVETTIIPDATKKRLDYLALGDSYSSGEGDFPAGLFATSHYLSDTDSPAKNGLPANYCHISSRSYPFLLGRRYEIDGDRMKSVACSGAVVNDLGPTSLDYRGQGDRLAGVSVQLRNQKQKTSLGDFSPGYIQQIEFVAKYKPEALTLTAGGNDIDFENILVACANADSPDTCSRAYGQGLARIGMNIYHQFARLTQLYRAIKTVSPSTKIFVVGYPEFISDSGPCFLNAGLLNKEERIMIVESIRYLNKVIKAAAQAAGVVYIDIENSLEGGRMCEPTATAGEALVTGLHRVNGILSDRNHAQSFHPNARGHEAITRKIVSELSGYTLLNYPHHWRSDDSVQRPLPPKYFQEAIDDNWNRSIGALIVSEPEIIKGTEFTVRQEYHTFKGMETVYTTTFSDPVIIGQGVATADGAYEATVTIPDTIPAGYHTLTLSGKSPADEPIEIFQYITVLGTNPNDRDENGIPDDDQSCGLFMTVSGRDMDGDSVDDACDPEISTRVSNPGDGRSLIQQRDLSWMSSNLNKQISNERIVRKYNGVTTDNKPDDMAVKKEEEGLTLDRDTPRIDNHVTDEEGLGPPEIDIDVKWLVLVIVVAVAGGLIVYALRRNR